MSSAVDAEQAPAEERAETADAAPGVIRLTRRRLDTILIWTGVVAAAALIAAGALLTWGSNFAEDYVSDELTAQNIVFPPAEALEEEGRTDLVGYGGEQVTTGDEAEAYASFIQGHVDNIAGGLTYSELGTPEREADAALAEAIANDAPAEEIEALEIEAATITGQRDAVFRGEMLRGTLLNTYAWDTVGQIAWIAAIVSYVAAGLMLVLVAAGVVHQRRTPKPAS